MPQETELKLRLLDPTEAVKLSTHPCLAQAKARPARQLDNCYFDTPKLNLRKMGIGLRIRRDGERLIQSVKTAGSSVGGLHQRQEWETEIACTQPQYEVLPEWIRRHKLSDPRIMARLQECFRTDFTRVCWDIEYAGSYIELSLDQGEIQAGSRRAPICEVELELKRGDPAALYQLALILSADIGLVIDNRSKAQRGYALRHPCPPVARKIGAFKLMCHNTAEKAFIALIWQCLSTVQANEEAAMLGHDPEGVHQMRVALRHLRSCLSLYHALIPTPDEIRAELRWLSAILGKARDLDILDAMLDSAARQAQSNWLVENLRQHAANERQQAYAAVCDGLNSVRYSRLLLHISAWLSARAWRADINETELARLHSPASDFAAHVLRRQHRRVRKHGQNLDQLNAQARHQLRIESKKLAYGARFFRALFPDASAQKRAAAYLDTLSGLRDALGLLNDSTNARAYLSRAPLPPDAPSRYFFQGWCAAQEVYALQSLPSLWARLRRLSPFWRRQESDGDSA
jgi:triphosphatase